MTNEIENTKRLLDHCLGRVIRAGKHRVLTAELVERLEEHLEALRKELDFQAEHTSKIRQANTEIQERLHAVDRAYFEQSQRNGEQARQIEKLEELNRIAGEELQHVQSVSRFRDIEVKSGRQLLAGRDETIAELRAELTKVREISRRNLEDCRSAEKCSDDFSEKLRDAQAVIGHQEQLIVGQRLAIAELHMVVRSAKSAVATLKRLGYTDCGDQQWKPPIGIKPDFENGHCETFGGPAYVYCNGGRSTAPCPKGCQ
jgi:chromosome segregation ATPase